MQPPRKGLQAKRDALKYRGNNGHHHPARTLSPALVETYGYLGKPLVRYQHTLSEVAVPEALQ